MKRLCSMMMFIAAMTFMMACGGDDATSAGGSGSGGSGGSGSSGGQDVSYIGEWIIVESKSYGFEAEVIKFNADGTGSVTEYELKTSSTSYYYGPTNFTYTISGNQFTIKMATGSTVTGVFATGTYNGSKFISMTINGNSIVFSEMTTEVRNEINSFNPVKYEENNTPPSSTELTDGYYVEKNLNMNEYFTVEIKGTKIIRTSAKYGKKTVLEGNFQISGNQLVVDIDENGDGVVDHNYNYNFSINGDELTIEGMTFVLSTITADMLEGRWQAYRTVGAEYKKDGSIKEKWDRELSGVSTGDEKKDNDNVRMHFNGGNFESWALRSNSWALQVSGTYTFSGRTVSCRYVDGTYTYEDDWNIVTISATESVVERYDGENYVAYYMRKY